MSGVRFQASGATFQGPFQMPGSRCEVSGASRRVSADALFPVPCSLFPIPCSLIRLSENDAIILAMPVGGYCQRLKSCGTEFIDQQLLWHAVPAPVFRHALWRLGSLRRR